MRIQVKLTPLVDTVILLPVITTIITVIQRIITQMVSVLTIIKIKLIILPDQVRQKNHQIAVVLL